MSENPLSNTQFEILKIIHDHTQILHRDIKIIAENDHNRKLPSSPTTLYKISKKGIVGEKIFNFDFLDKHMTSLAHLSNKNLQYKGSYSMNDY
jgi:hypothetical protein